MPGGNHNNYNNHRGRGRGRGGGRGRPPWPGPANTPRGPRHSYPHSNAEIDVEIQQWVEPDLNARNTNGIGNANRGQGPWRTPKSRSGAGTPSRGVESPRRGTPTPRGRGWGRGRGRGRGFDPDNGPPRRPRFGVGNATKAKPMIGRDAPLSELLFSERPLLRPIKFVRAKLTPFLFQHSEEMLRPTGDVNADTTERSHVPTADRVAQLFRESASDSDSESDDALEEIDFADLAQMRAEVDAIAQGVTTVTQGTRDAHGDIEEVDFADLGAIRAQVDTAKPQVVFQDDIIEEVFTGVYNRVKDVDDAQQIESLSISHSPVESPSFGPSMEISNHSNRTSVSDTIVIEEDLPCSSNEPLDVSATESSVPETQSVPILVNDSSPPPDTNPHPLFIIDTSPTLPLPHRSESDVILVDRAGHGETLGEDDEQIVYVAPNPRSGRVSPVTPVKLPRASTLAREPIREDEGAPASVEEEDFLSLARLSLDSPEDAKDAKRVRQKEARKRQRQSKLGFGALGAIVSEARLREADMAEKQRPRWATRRRGDSDIDWGTEGGDGDALSDGGMAVDADLDVGAMHGFLKSMSAEGSKFVTIDDIEDEARLRQEDEEGQGGPQESSDSEPSDDEVVEDDEEEAVFNVEEKILIAESDDEADSDDDELTPRSSFKARLRKVRETSVRPSAVAETSDDEDEDAPWARGADDNDELLARLQDIIDDNAEILSDRNRKQKKALFRNLHEGYIDDAEFTTPVQKKKGKEKQFTGPLASELQAQWAKDRAKKAARKQERATARLIAALDPLSTTNKPSRKAMRAAARLESAKAQSLTPHAIVDVDALEAQIRRFVQKNRASVALPPMSKEARKVVHELAVVFGLKSVSKGKGNKRYTTLFRTNRTGMGVKEDRVRAVMRRNAGRGRGGGKGTQIPKHKEGDEVGKEAPKIGEGNIGFRMLASMGWSEGAHIGGSFSVGIEAPLMAVIKHSKLGLGATR